MRERDVKASPRSNGTWRALRPAVRDFLTPLNLMTLSRLLLAAPLLQFLSGGSIVSTYLAVAVIALWAFNDWLDGYLARKWHMGNPLGVVLDPLVDRLSTASALTGLMAYRDLPVWAGAFIVTRELVLVLVGFFVAFGRGRGRPSNLLGKANQWVLGSCMVAYVVRSPVSGFLLAAALLTTVLSSVSYALSLRRVRPSGICNARSR
jgi:CDP-diacylglycerol--glycerol-3-phosphate 3-phosphatidyltransferase